MECLLTPAYLAIKMEGLNEPSRSPKQLLSFRTRANLDNYSVGVDSDIGGSSSARLDFVPDDPNDPSHDAKGKGRFWGEMRLGVRGDLKGKVRGGYAGFRSKARSLLEPDANRDAEVFLVLFFFHLRSRGRPCSVN